MICFFLLPYLFVLTKINIIFYVLDWFLLKNILKFILHFVDSIIVFSL